MFRRPTPDDARRIWRLVRACPALDDNSLYAYLLLCDHFRETCLLAERGGMLLGFVAAYRPPEKNDVVFVWQVAVAPEARGMGLGVTLIERLLQTGACHSARYLEATVTPSNVASRRLFAAVARGLEAPLQWKPGYTQEQFGAPATGQGLNGTESKRTEGQPEHEAEELLRIGPLTTTRGETT